MYYQICRKTIVLFTLPSVFTFVFETKQLTQTVSAQLQSPPETNEKLALTNATLIDGNGGKPRTGVTLLISEGRITDIFSTGSKELPADIVIMGDAQAF
jgi:hypothetical protein